MSSIRYSEKFEASGLAIEKDFFRKANLTVQVNFEITTDEVVPQRNEAVRFEGSGSGKSEHEETTTSTMPSLGTKEFEELSRSLDTRSLGYRYIKRMFDIVFSFLVLAVLVIAWPLPVGLLIVIAIQTKGFPIYVQERVGQYGRKIRVPKLRTMVADSDHVEKHLNAEQLEEWHKERKVTEDPRIVPIGKFIRSTSIDEIPNFFVCLNGSMSVVGPRPIVVEETTWYGEDLAKVLSVPQGITGWWQCKERNSATFESGQRQKLELNYANNASISRDIKVFFSTFSVMFGKNRNGL